MNSSYWLILYDETARKILEFFKLQNELNEISRKTNVGKGVFGIEHRIPINRTAVNIFRGDVDKNISSKDECLSKAAEIVDYCRKYSFEQRENIYKHQLLTETSLNKKVRRPKKVKAPIYKTNEFIMSLVEWRTFPNSIHMKKVIIGSEELLVTSPRDAILRVCCKFIEDGILTHNMLDKWDLDWISTSKYIKNPIEIAENIYYSCSRNWRKHFLRIEILFDKLGLDIQKCRIVYNLVQKV